MSDVFDNISSIFKIGLSPLDLESWLEIDERCGEYLREKQQLIATRIDDVFVAEADTEDSQYEVLELVKDFLSIHTDLDVQSGDNGRPALLQAANLIQEDLVLMRRDDTGWRLVAGSVCFPSNWGLREKFGKPISDIHGPVPGFGPKSRNDVVINRIFDKLSVDGPVERQNWSLSADQNLPHWPASGTKPPRQFDDGVFVRVERQTLRKMPKSGDILFTIHIHVQGFDQLARHPNRKGIASALMAGLNELTEEQLRYKALINAKPFLLNKLTALSGGNLSMKEHALT